MKFDKLFWKNKHKKFARDYDIIKDYFDVAYYREANSDLAGRKIDPIIHYLEHGSREGRRPAPDFDPHYYLRQYGGTYGEVDPFVHYVSIGRALGHKGAEFDFRHTDELVRPNGVVPSRRPLDEEDFALAVPLPDDLRGFGFPRVAAIVHAYYPDLMGEIFEKLEECPCPIDIFISTDTQAKKIEILEAGRTFERGSVEVRVAPNRGRDVGPMITLFGDVFETYPAFLHLHTKKSLHAGDVLANIII